MRVMTRETSQFDRIFDDLNSPQHTSLHPTSTDSKPNALPAPGALIPNSLDPSGRSWIHQPIAQIDWTYLLSQRPILLTHEDQLPPYLLKPEIHRILNATKDYQTHFLLDTLWHTGARISEALSLTRNDFVIGATQPHLSIPTAKQRGRPKKNAQPRRFLPIGDEAYITRCEQYFASTGGRASERVFPMTRQTANNRLQRVIDELERKDGWKPSIEVSPHTIRHSFAVNAILHFVDVATLQSWLGHRRRESTEIYTRVLAAETAHLMKRVEF